MVSVTPQKIVIRDEQGEVLSLSPQKKKDGSSFFHQLPPLTFQTGQLAPSLSQEAVEYHYFRHHTLYLNRMNQLIEGTFQEQKPLQALVKEATGVLFNQVAQVMNHSFLWSCWAPVSSQGTPLKERARAQAPRLFHQIEKDFGSFEECLKQFQVAGLGLFGSGWVWLVRSSSQGSLSWIGTSNAATPFAEEGRVPVYVCDVWEHAYYVDYRSERAQYLKAQWEVCHWAQLEAHYIGA